MDRPALERWRKSHIAHPSQTAPKKLPWMDYAFQLSSRVVPAQRASRAVICRRPRSDLSGPSPFAARFVETKTVPFPRKLYARGNDPETYRRRFAQLQIA